jgi:hypothetical protein
MKILIRGLNVSDDKLKTLDTDAAINIHRLGRIIKAKYRQFRKCRFVISCNGKISKFNDGIDQNNIYFIKPLMLGGKGGFGSLLKGQPPVKKRTNNFDSCRDLSGRRIRHVNQEKMLQEWQQKKQEEEKLLSEYETGDNVKDFLINTKKEETDKLNQQFIQETNNITSTVTASIKYLLRKKQREQPKQTLHKEPIKVIDDVKDIESLEKELFSL